MSSEPKPLPIGHHTVNGKIVVPENDPVRTEPTVYDFVTGEPLPPKAPEREPAHLPGSRVEVAGDDPLDVSGLRSIEDTPEARQEDAQVQRKLLAEHRRKTRAEAIPYDLDDLAAEWGLGSRRNPWANHGHYDPSANVRL